MKQYNYHMDSCGVMFPNATSNLYFEPEFFYIDLFCGTGGTTTGVEDAVSNGKKLAKVIACVNHDPVAIQSHYKNHPDVIHFEEDIRTLELGPLSSLVEAYRALYPKAKIVLWASLECTNFSKAKGGQPRDADSRTLADHLERYVTAIDPDYIQIENVVEFMSWGPLDQNGKPVSKKSGSDWLRWRREICRMGYYDEWKELNSADFGAYTSRNRLFGCFSKHGLPIKWPVPTHTKKPSSGGLLGNTLEKWKAVKDVLDFNDEGVSIFTRKKPLSDKTLERIYAGLVKYVAGGKDAFMVKWNSMSASGKYSAPNTEDPCPVISTQNRLGMCFIAKYYSGKPEGKVIPVTGPAGTIKTSDGQALVQPIPFMVQRNSGNPESKVVGVDGPARTLTATGGNQDLVTTAFIAKYYGNGDNLNSIEEPAGTLTTKDRLAKVQPIWIINPSHGGHSSSIERPCPVIIARQDKAPLYLANVDQGMIDIDMSSFLQPADFAYMNEINTSGLSTSEMPIRLKIIEFMSLYSIADIKMRMLKVSELKVIQGFPKDYVLCGTQTNQKKFIGNSVVPNVVKSWCEAMSTRN